MFLKFEHKQFLDKWAPADEDPVIWSNAPEWLLMDLVITQCCWWLFLRSRMNTQSQSTLTIYLGSGLIFGQRNWFQDAPLDFQSGSWGVYIYIYFIVHTCMFPVQTPANQIIHLTCELVTFKASKQCEPLFWCPAAFVEHFKDVFLKY